MLDTFLTVDMNISGPAYADLKAAATLKSAMKGQLLFRAGHVNRKMLFLEKGLMRAYRILDGNEFTHYFFLENWFATDFKSYLTESPSELFVEALTPITYYELEKEQLQSLFAKHHSLETMGRFIAEQAYLRMAERLLHFQTQDLKTRYVSLINHNPSLFQQVPQKHIASYLGVTEQSLSRVKHSLKNHK